MNRNELMNNTNRVDCVLMSVICVFFFLLGNHIVHSGWTMETRVALWLSWAEAKQIEATLIISSIENRSCQLPPETTVAHPAIRQIVLHHWPTHASSHLGHLWLAGGLWAFDRLVDGQNQASSLAGGLQCIDLDDWGLPDASFEIVGNGLLADVNAVPDLT